MPFKCVEITLDTDILTASSTANVVSKILELLLYQRNQIPFVYNVYQFYVSKWPEDGQEEDDCSERNFQLERQRAHARQTSEAISEMHKVYLMQNI